MMTIDEIEDILIDGTEEEILTAVQKYDVRPLKYYYDPETRGFAVVHGKGLSQSYKMHVVPKCTEYFGMSYEFE